MAELFFPEELIQTLDKLGEEKPDTNHSSAELAAWRNLVWESLEEFLVSEIHLPENRQAIGRLPDYKLNLEEAIYQFVKEGLKYYDPEKGSLSNNAYTILKKELDRLKVFNLVDRKSAGSRSAESIQYYMKKRSSFANEKTGISSVERDELLDQLDEENRVNAVSTSLEDGLEMELIDPSASMEDRMVSAEEMARAQQLVYELSAQIIGLLNRQTKERANSSRKIFFPKWFTEKIARYVEENDNLWEENTVLFALEFSYLDFFLEQKCRSIEEIESSPLKKEAELFPDAPPEKRLMWNNSWLPTKVPIRYLAGEKEYAGSTITRSRDDYLSFIREIIQA